MKKDSLILIIGLLILASSNSCKKSDSPVHFNPEFPTNIGSFWKYRLYYSINNRIDTITIKVLRQTNLDNGELASEWEITSLYDPISTRYVTNNNDGIRIYFNTITTSGPLKRYVFPLLLGNSWTTRYNIDTNKVTENGAVSVIAGSFANGYRIKRDVVIPPGYNPIKEDEWFVPNIGMVSRYYFEVGPGYIIKNKWELLNYSIK